MLGGINAQSSGDGSLCENKVKIKHNIFSENDQFPRYKPLCFFKFWFIAYFKKGFFDIVDFWLGYKDSKSLIKKLGNWAFSESKLRFVFTLFWSKEPTISWGLDVDVRATRYTLNVTNRTGYLFIIYLTYSFANRLEYIYTGFSTIRIFILN